MSTAHSPEARPRGRSGAAILLAGLAAVALASLWLKPFNHDVAWFLHAAGRMLDGDRLYVDFVDPNPPLVFHLSAGPVWLARQLGLESHALFSAFVVALAGVSLLLADRLLRRDSALPAGVRPTVLAALWIAFLVLMPSTWGQREHLASILMTPYVLTTWLAVRGIAAGRPAALAAGVMAGVALGLKPFFGVTCLVLELAVVLRRRRPLAVVRTEVIATACFGACGFVLLAAAHPAYLRDIVPLARSQYWAYEQPWLKVLGGGRFDLLVLGTLLLWLLAGRLLRRGHAAELGQMLLLAALGFAVTYVAQRKGWDYHRLPVAAFTLVGAAATAATLLARGGAGTPGRSTGLLRRCCLALAVLVLAGLTYGALDAHQRLMRQPSIVRQIAAAVRAQAAGEAVFFLSSSVWPAFPVVNLAGAVWPYRYNCLWPLPAFYRDDGPWSSAARPSPLEREIKAGIAAELAAIPPRLIVVDNSPVKQGFAGAAFDYLAYFLEDPTFARMWLGYRHVADSGSFRLYRRKD